MSKRLDDALARFPCQKKQMFGYPAYFLNGNMFAGIHQDCIIARLSAEDRSDILASPGDASPFEPMPGRPMKEYVVLLGPIYDDPVRLDGWLSRSFEYVSSLPAKEARSKGQGKKKPGR